MQRKRYTSSVGQKFNQDGTPREYPGNTVLCRFTPESRGFEILRDVCEKTKALPWADKFSFLPPSSYHMTVFDGVCDQIRTQAHWTSKLPLNASLEEVDDLLRKSWRRVPKPKKIQVGYKSFYTTRGFIGLYVTPTPGEIAAELRDFRDRLSEVFGIRHPNHKTYAFHITLAYGIEILTPGETKKALRFSRQVHNFLEHNFGILKLKSPELTFFADMTCFASTRPPFPTSASWLSP